MEIRHSANDLKIESIIFGGFTSLRQPTFDSIWIFEVLTPTLEWVSSTGIDDVTPYLTRNSNLSVHSDLEASSPALVSSPI